MRVESLDTIRVQVRRMFVRFLHNLVQKTYNLVHLLYKHAPRMYKVVRFRRKVGT